jgi:hypothetical protein
MNKEIKYTLKKEKEKLNKLVKEAFLNGKPMSKNEIIELSRKVDVLILEDLKEKIEQKDKNER